MPWGTVPKAKGDKDDGDFFVVVGKFPCVESVDVCKNMAGLMHVFRLEAGRTSLPSRIQLCSPHAGK